MANGFITALMTDFAYRCQIEQLFFDGDDCCHLLIDQDTAITVRAEDDRLTLIGLISGDKPEHDVMLQYMKASLTQGSPAVYWDEEVGFVGFVHLSQQWLDAAILDESLGNFIEWLKSTTNSTISDETSAPVMDANQFSTLRV
ncbi:TPA: CesT family type III secretion system chaperone [Vibrio parahaemolyticus]|nr:CesT family type III secretion system chaperone [Vibrio parahaemolyticus]